MCTSDEIDVHCPVDVDSLISGLLADAVRIGHTQPSEMHSELAASSLYSARSACKSTCLASRRAKTSVRKQKLSLECTPIFPKERNSAMS